LASPRRLASASASARRRPSTTACVGRRGSGLGFGIDSSFRAWGLEFGVWGLGFGVWGLGLGV
jgi:hypothetical protein